MAKVGSSLMSITVAPGSADATPKAAAAAPSAAKPAAATATAAAPPAASVGAVEASLTKVLTTPAVRRLAMEHRVDLTTVCSPYCMCFFCE